MESCFEKNFPAAEECHARIASLPDPLITSTHQSIIRAFKSHSTIALTYFHKLHIFHRDQFHVP